MGRLAEAELQAAAAAAAGIEPADEVRPHHTSGTRPCRKHYFYCPGAVDASTNIRRGTILYGPARRPCRV
jgi:hypothetical protein